MVDGLLALTTKGQELVAAARQSTQARLAEMLGSLPETDCIEVTRVMESLRLVFGAQGRGRSQAKA